MGDFLYGLIAGVAFSQTLYFLFEVRQVRVIKNKNRGGSIDRQRKGWGCENFLALCARSFVLTDSKRTKRKVKQRLCTGQGFCISTSFTVGHARLLVEYQVTRDKFSNMPKIYYNSCLISKSRKTRYTSYPEVDVNEVRRTRLSFSQSNTCGATSHVLGFETINGEEFIACNLYYMICVVSSCHEKFSYSESCSTHSERRDQTIPEWSLIGS